MRFNSILKGKFYLYQISVEDSMQFNDYDRSLSWRQLLAQSLNTPTELATVLGLDATEAEQITACFPARINPYYLSLIKTRDDALWRQAVPDMAELLPDGGSIDPLCEEIQSPVPGLTHRYPDRVILLVSEQCAVFCRFCMRKRKTGGSGTVTPETVDAGIEYIRQTPAVRDVILSGGDPLMLSDDELADILRRLKAIPHVEIIRIHSRIPCTLPQRVTPELAQMLRRFQPLFINTHFNHPDELTPEAARACALLSDAGISLGCQTVLLKGVNDDTATMQRLLTGLLRLRVRPYYLHHPDAVAGTAHFRPSVKRGLAIMRSLRGHISGMAVPQYMLDLPLGGGKIPVLPEYVCGSEKGLLLLKNFRGEIYRYPCDEGL